MHVKRDAMRFSTLSPETANHGKPTWSGRVVSHTIRPKRHPDCLIGNVHADSIDLIEMRVHTI